MAGEGETWGDKNDAIRQRRRKGAKCLRMFRHNLGMDRWLAHLDHGALNADGENGMRSAGVVIELGAAGGAVLHAVIVEFACSAWCQEQLFVIHCSSTLPLPARALLVSDGKMQWRASTFVFRNMYKL